MLLNLRVLLIWQAGGQCFSSISAFDEMQSSSLKSGNWSGSKFLIWSGFPHNSIFDSLSCRFPQWGPLFVGIGLTLCNPRLIASSWKYFSYITLEAVKSPILSVGPWSTFEKFVDKFCRKSSIPLLFITWCTSNDAVVTLGILFSCGLIKELLNFPLFFNTEQI